MNSFELIFTGDQELLDKTQWNAKLQLHGEIGTIGKLLAQFALQEYKNGNPDLLRILINVLAKLQNDMPGFGDRKFTGGLVN